MGVVIGLVLMAVALALLAWAASHDRGPNPRETFDPSTRQRIDAMRDAEGEALDHVCGHCASPPWSDTWMHDCKASCCSGGGAL